MKLLVHPRSLWLAYDMRHTNEIQQMLPSGLHVAPVRLFESDPAPRKRLLMNVYECSSSFMNGARIEVQTFVYNAHKNTVHLCILDCISNTMQWDPVTGIHARNALLQSPTSSSLLQPRDNDDMRSASTGAQFHVHFTSPEQNTTHRKTILRVSARVGQQMESPTRPFVVDANRICYFRNCDTPFPMRFDVSEVAAPVVRLANARVTSNVLKRYRAQRSPTHTFIHRTSMAFDVDVPNQIWSHL